MTEEVIPKDWKRVGMSRWAYAAWYGFLFIVPERLTLWLIEKSPPWLVREMARRYPPEQP